VGGRRKDVKTSWRRLHQKYSCSQRENRYFRLGRGEPPFAHKAKILCKVLLFSQLLSHSRPTRGRSEMEGPRIDQLSLYNLAYGAVRRESVRLRVRNVSLRTWLVCAAKFYSICASKSTAFLETVSHGGDSAVQSKDFTKSQSGHISKSTRSAGKHHWWNDRINSTQRYIAVGNNSNSTGVASLQSSHTAKVTADCS